MVENYPRTALELEQRFSDEQVCRRYLFALRWPEEFVCPRCSGNEAWETSRGLWLCRTCRYQLSVTAGRRADSVRRIDSTRRIDSVERPGGPPPVRHRPDGLAGRAAPHPGLVHLASPTTNNRTEQAIRHVVIDRRVTQGTRNWAGMRFCERAWTVVATCVRNDQSVYRFFLNALQATFDPNLPYHALIPQKA